MKNKILSIAVTVLIIAAEPNNLNFTYGLPMNPPNNIEGTSNVTSKAWTLRKAKDGIQIYTRWIVTEHQIRTRQIRGVVQINAKREHITHLITEEDLAKKWMVFLDVLNYYRIPDQPLAWYAYGKINLPAKIACFDVVTYNCILYDAQHSQTVITMNGINDYMPDEPGIHRIKGLYTSWTLISETPDMTRIEYMLYSDMKPVVPVWLTDPIVTSMMVSTLQKLRENVIESPIDPVNESVNTQNP